MGMNWKIKPVDITCILLIYLKVHGRIFRVNQLWNFSCKPDVLSPVLRGCPEFSLTESRVEFNQRPELKTLIL